MLYNVLVFNCFRILKLPIYFHIINCVECVCRLTFLVSDKDSKKAG